MDSQKPNNFEEEWQKAFNDASFAPPSDVWERIEQDLEQKKRRPFLFFLHPSAMLAGVAATLVLALGGILFFNQKESKTPITIINKNAKKVIANPQNINSQPNTSNTNTDNFILAAPSPTELHLSLENNATKYTLALSEKGIEKRVSNPKTSTINNQLPALAAASFANPNAVEMPTYVPASNNQLFGNFNTQTLDNQNDKSISVAKNDNKSI